MLYFDSYLQENPDCTIDLQKYEKWFKIPERLQGYLKRCRRQSKPVEPNEGILCTLLTHLLYWHGMINEFIVGGAPLFWLKNDHYCLKCVSMNNCFQIAMLTENALPFNVLPPSQK
jgi:hypothetical protein